MYGSGTEKSFRRKLVVQPSVRCSTLPASSFERKEPSTALDPCIHGNECGAKFLLKLDVFNPAPRQSDGSTACMNASTSGHMCQRLASIRSASFLSILEIVRTIQKSERFF